MEKRYELLISLIEKIDAITKHHFEFHKQLLIKIVENPIDQLTILSEENSKRFGSNDGYAGDINYLYRLLLVRTGTDDNDSIIQEYREFMISLIPIIRSGLQDMEVSLTARLIYYGYEFEKIYLYLANQEHQIGKSYFINLVKNACLPLYLLTCNNFDEKRLVMDAILHRSSTSLSRPLREDLIKND